MIRPRRLTRRRLAVVSMGGLGALGGRLAARPAATARQGGPPAWRIADGLRLAGSVNGLPSLDPARSRDLATNFLLRQAHRGLTSLDASLTPVPELAETVHVAADGLTYTFTLRQSARFHDGRPVTPDDVRRSLARAVDPRTTGGDVAALAGVTYLRDIRGADDMLRGKSDVLAGIVVSERAVSIALDRPAPTFLMKLASVPASIVDVEAGNLDADGGTVPIGSGPFAVTGWTPDASLELQAAETWWRGRAALGRVQVRLGASAGQPLNLFQGGEIDLLEDVPPELVDLLRDPVTGAPVGEILESSLFATSYIALGNTVPPLDDLQVRRALCAVFPHERVASATYDGAVRAAAGLVPPGMLGVDWPVARLSGDADAAREHLRRSHFGSAANVPPIPVYAADIAVVESLAEIAAAELGLRVEAIQVAWPDFLAGLAARRFPAYAIYWGADYPDPEAFIDMLFGTGSPENYTGYGNPDLDLLLEEARRVSGPERIDVYARANQLLIDDAAVIPLYHPVGYTVTRPGIGGVTATPMGVLGLESINERR